MLQSTGSQKVRHDLVTEHKVWLNIPISFQVLVQYSYASRHMKLQEVKRNCSELSEGAFQPSGTDFQTSDFQNSENSFLLLLVSKSVVMYYNNHRKLISVCVSPSVVSDSLGPRGLQPARLLCPWDSPGKTTGVGCHFLLDVIIITTYTHTYHTLHIIT